jgi:hypothetical protein
MPRTFIPPEECPVCGETVPPGARACPGCGADERSGWNDEATRHDGLDLPDEAFDDDRPPTPIHRPPRDRIWVALAVLVILAVIMTIIFR